jgi:hypothetical protein
MFIEVVELEGLVRMENVLLFILALNNKYLIQ